MAQSVLDKIPLGPKLDALTAEKIFGWKNVHKHEGTLVGKKQDRAGRWRLAKVPYYSTNLVHAYSIEGPNETAWAVGSILERTLQGYSHQKYPEEWAAPDQRCRAAIKAVGYGRVIPLNKNRKRTQK
jgi:hypothetical protein